MTWDLAQPQPVKNGIRNLRPLIFSALNEPKSHLAKISTKSQPKLGPKEAIFTINPTTHLSTHLPGQV